MTAQEAIAKWIRENKSNIDAGYLTELPTRGADLIVKALNDAGYVVIRDRMDPEGGIPGRS